MGFNTVAFFLNDQTDALCRDPGAVAITLRNAMSSGRGAKYGPGGMRVLPSVHADYQQVVVAGGNRITLLGACHGLSHEPADILKQLADQHGYRLVRKPQR